LRKSQLRITKAVSAICAICLACAPVSVTANEFYQLTLGAGNEDNVPRVIHNPATAESGVFSAGLTGGKLLQFGLNHSVVLSAQMNANRYLEHSGFDSIDVNATASYAYKFGLGAYAPRLGAAVALGTVSMDGKARDRHYTTTAITIEQRLSPSWLLSAGLDYHVSRGESLAGDDRLLSFGYDPNNTLSYGSFDDDAVSMFAEVAYDFPNGMMLTGGYNRSDGFTVSSTQKPSLKIYKISKAVYVDPAWPDLWFAYRIPSTTDDWSLGLSMPVSRDASVNLGASWQEIDGPTVFNYKNRLLSVSYVHNF